MQLVLRRKFKGTQYTIGDLTVNGVFFCNTIEDVVRPNGVKVYGETAIPFGTYKVVMRYSPKYKKVLPLLLDVPNFIGIRIHSGNTQLDSLGCIIVGENKVKGRVINSRKTMDKLLKLFELHKGEEHTIQII
jgi:hypothetical protein